MALKLMSLTCSNKALSCSTSGQKEWPSKALLKQYEPDIAFLHGSGSKRDVENHCKDKDQHVVIKSDGQFFSGLVIRKTCTRIATKSDMCNSSILHKVRYKCPSNKTVDIRKITALVVTINHMDILLVAWNCIDKGANEEITKHFSDLMEFIHRIMDEIGVPRLILSVCCSMPPSEAQALTQDIVYGIGQTNDSGEIQMYNYFITVHPSVTLLGLLKVDLPCISYKLDENSGQFNNKLAYEAVGYEPIIAYINPIPYVLDDIIRSEDVYSIWLCAIMFWQTCMDKYLYEVQYLQATFSYHLNVTMPPLITSWSMTLHGEIHTFWEEWLKLQESWESFYERSLRIVQTPSDANKETRPIQSECHELCNDWLPRIGKFQEKLNLLFAVAAEFSKPSSMHHSTFFTGIDTDNCEDLVHKGYDRAYKLYQIFMLVNRDRHTFKTWISSPSEDIHNDRNTVLNWDIICDQLEEWPRFSFLLGILNKQGKTQFRYRSYHNSHKVNKSPDLKP